MADTNFRVLTVPDDEVVKRFQRICESLDCKDTAKLRLTIQAGGQGSSVDGALADVLEREDVRGILEVGSTILREPQLQMLVGNKQVTLTLHRDDGFDRLQLSIHDQLQFPVVSSVLRAVRSAFQDYDRTNLIDKTLSPELSEFYERREAALLRLEELSERLIRKNEEYRLKLDADLEAEKEILRKQLSEAEKGLKSDYQEKVAKNEEREQELEKREEELDDSSSTHARRQLRQDLKGALDDRNTQFSLTRDTQRKRWPVHALYGVLIAGTTLAAVTYGGAVFLNSSSTLWEGVRFTLSIAAALGAIAWYIKWQDRWSQAHADEEFRLKRLDLDIDRASWLVEIMLEWKEEKGTGAPPEMIEKLGHGLFQDNPSLVRFDIPVKNCLRPCLQPPLEFVSTFPAWGR